MTPKPLDRFSTTTSQNYFHRKNNFIQNNINTISADAIIKAHLAHLKYSLKHFYPVN